MYFSIIIPVYNCEQYIKRCIESLKKQTFRDFEVLIIDDGSTDNSKKIIEHFIQDDKHFIYLYKNNAGVSSARNLGLSQSKGNYVIFIDSDDWVEPTLLEEIYNIGNSYDIIQYDFYKINKKHKKEIHIKSELKEIIQGEGAVVWKRAFKKDVIKNIFFDTALIGGEDYLFCVQVFLNMKSFYYIDRCLYNYNISNLNSTMHKNFIQNLQSQLSATDKVANLLQTNKILDIYNKDLDKRYFWCLTLFNEWQLQKKIKLPLVTKIILKIIKLLLK